MKRRRLPRFMPRLGFPQILGLLTAFLLVIALIFILYQPKVILTFVVPAPEAPAWKPLIEEFQANNPGIHIEIVDKQDAEVETTYTSALGTANSAYQLDLVYMDIIWVPEFAHKEWVMDLTQEFPQEELRGFIRSEVESGRYEDKLYRIPFRADVGVLFYRQDWLNEVKEKRPETFNDLLRISQKVKQQLPEKVQYGYLWQSKPDEGLAAVFVEVLYGYGGFWINNKKVGLNQPEAIQAVEFLRDTIKLGISPKDITTYDEQYTRSLFRDRQAVFMRNWPNVWLDVNGSEPSFRGKIAIKPMVYAEGKRSVASKGGWGFGIAKNTKHKKEALQAIKFFTSAASQQKFTLAYASVPSRRNLFFEPKIVAKYSHYPELLKVVENSVARPRIPQYAQASCILQKYLSEALNPDNNGYKQAMDAAAKETQNLLDSGKYNCQI